MSGYNKFDSEVYSEELFNVTESEYDEVMQMIAEENEALEGYCDWSQELESDAWRGSKSVNGILIKKACEHARCPHTRCAKAVRIGGIEI